MSVAVESALIRAQERAAKDRVASANGRYAAAFRSKRGVADPQVRDNYRSELTTAVIARDITTAVVNWPHLSVSQRFELIDLLMPSDSDAANEILGLLRESRAGGEDAHGST